MPERKKSSLPKKSHSSASRYQTTDLLLPPAKSAPTITWGKLPDGPRLSPQVRQEQSSKSALMGWLEDHEWMPSEPKVDLGEDLLVNIYENQRATGLSLFIQHKSAADIDKFKLKKDNVLSYPIETKDLGHWQKFAVPVYLVICDDRDKTERYWININQAIAGIEKSGQAILDQETVQIRIPLTNRLNDDALSRIRTEVADRMLPVYQKQHGDIGISLALNFPANTEGVRKRRAFTRFLDAGHPVTLGREYIKEFRFTDWMDRLYGPIRAESITFSPQASKSEVRFRLEITPADGSPSASYPVSLRVVRRGRQEALLSNKASTAPILFEVRFTRSEDHTFVRLHFSMRHAGNTIFDTRDALRFMIAAGHDGIAHLIEESSGKSITTEFQPATPLQLERLKGQFGLVEQLCFIQHKLRLSKSICLKGQDLKEEDYRKVEDTYNICKHGKIDYVGVFGGSVDLDDDLRKSIEEPINSDATIELAYESGVSCDLFGVQADLGKCQSHIKLTHEQTIFFVDQLRKAIRLGKKKTKVSIESVRMEVIYPQWAPNKNC